MQCALSRQISDVTFPSRLNGGKILLNYLPQSVKKTSTALASGSQDQKHDFEVMYLSW